MDSTPYGIQKIGTIAERSDGVFVPPPRELLRVIYYQQRKGAHPGQPPGEPPREWALPAGREVVELVTGGRGWVRTGTEWVEVTAGALLWHGAGDQTIGASDWQNPYQCLALSFRVGERERGRRCDRLSWWPDREAVAAFSRELLHGFQEESPDRETLFHYSYGQLLYRARVGRQTGPDWPRPLREAVALLEAGAVENRSVREVARLVGWSVPHLHHVFRQRLGVSPHQFMLARRIRKARERLSLTTQPIKQIAVETGFATAAAFCRTFRERVGITPTEYRQREQAGLRVPV